MKFRYLKIRLHYLLGVSLLLIIAVLSALLSVRYSTVFDFTNNNRYTLSSVSQQLLAQFIEPIHIRIYVSNDPTLREPIENIIFRYQRYDPTIQIQFIDPYKAPADVKERQVTLDGEILLEYQGQTTHVQKHATKLTEQDVSSALQTLLRPTQRIIRFLTWHGERSPFTNANHDVSHWATQLQNTGFIIQTLQFDKTHTIPADTTVLIIASPQVPLLPDEMMQIIDYVDKGGNLLWLLEPEETIGLEKLMEKLGIIVQPGIIIDPNSQVPSMTTATPYRHHPIIDGFILRSLFPRACGLIASPPAEWQVTDLLLTPENAWLEQGKLQAPIQYDKGVDIPGPLTIAVALSRTQSVDNNLKEQRIIVIGDGDFLSNAFLQNGGNAELGSRIINWLSHDDKLINIPTTIRKDLSLSLSEYESIFLGGLFLVVLPISFFSMSLFIWLRRRKI
ncbi:GldG family protein [Beggiatoa leptomitoformis]|uniref:ABC transporter n=1 Tax=Beggiatoa leptomitoformis TaxID=288004 RepID=A0A2N9YDA6_9GAMM|nr:GldG family protein [Beggiatoa leptomitoformis]ALG69138.1 ABC transporter [Beggiatoa leptomitoformis]AUI68444.1 ABC transporter [Beggiatoa leptomitoformis]